MTAHCISFALVRSYNVYMCILYVRLWHLSTGPRIIHCMHFNCIRCHTFRRMSHNEWKWRLRRDLLSIEIDSEQLENSCTSPIFNQEEAHRCNDGFTVSLNNYNVYNIRNMVPKTRTINDQMTNYSLIKLCILIFCFCFLLCFLRLLDFFFLSFILIYDHWSNAHVYLINWLRNYLRVKNIQKQKEYKIKILNNFNVIRILNKNFFSFDISCI